MKRYYELVLSGRQLALLLAVLAGLLLLAFGLGVAVGLGQGEKEQTAVLKGSELIKVVADSNRSASEMRQPQEQPTAMSPFSGMGLEPTPTPSPLVETVPTALVVPTPEPVLPVATPTPSPPPRKPAKEEVWVQVAAVRAKRNAEGIRQRVIAQGFRFNQVKIFQGSGGKYRVRVGPFPDRESGGRVTQRLRASGFPNAFMVTP